MLIYLLNPKTGGRKIADSEQEAKADEKNGWIRLKHARDKMEIPAVEKAVEAPTTSKDLTLAEQYAAKFGKKPHHRMSQKTIESALKE